MVKPLKQLFFLLSALLTVAGAYAQVNLQTGSAAYSIPLYQYADNKSRLILPVVLSYNSANGLKVNEVASSVGTGWQIQTGGLIARMQVGQPDDQIAKNGTWYDITRYPNGYLYNSNIGGGCPVGMSYYPIFGNERMPFKQHNAVSADREQDKFVFQFGGRSGSFVIGRNRQVLQIGDSRLKISFKEEDMTVKHIRTTISQFTITDENGVQYTFRDQMLSKSLRYKYIKRDNQGNINIVKGNPDNGDKAVNIMRGIEMDEIENPYIVSGWYLSEIKDGFNGRKIQFVYNTNIVNGFGSHSISLSTAYDNTVKSQVLVMENNTVNLVKNLASINCPDGVSVKFNYGDKRIDLNGDKILSSVGIYDNGNNILSWKFTQAYFLRNTIGQPINNTDRQYARLCLTKVQKNGYDNNTKEPPYLFNYYTGTEGNPDDIVPAPFSLAQDRWGYYNGNTTGVNLDFTQPTTFQHYTNFTNFTNRIPKTGYAQNGLLKEIIYPTGGTIKYTWQQNQDRNSDLAGNQTGGVSVKRTIIYDGNSHDKDIIKEYRYIQADGSPSGWGYENYLNQKRLSNHYSPNGKRWDPATGCDFDYKYPGLEYPEMAGGFNKEQALKMFSDIVSYLSFGYGIYQVINSAVTSTALSYNIFSFVLNILITAALTCDDDAYIKNFAIFNQYGDNLYLPSALPFRYGRLEEADVSPGINNGKIVYEFSDKNFLNQVLPFDPPSFAPKQRNAAWAYGLPLKTTIFDKDNNKVKETENEFFVSTRTVTDTNFQSCRCETQKQTSLSAYDWTDNPYYNSGLTNNPANQEGITIEFYKPITGYSELRSIRDRIYSKDGQMMEIFKRNEYHPGNYQIKKAFSLNRMGDTIETRYYYPEDYTIPGALEKLKANNAINMPVSVEVWQRKNNTGYQLIDATITEFQELSNGDILPAKIYTLQTDKPVPLAQAGNFNPAVLIRNNDLFKLKNTISYDINGLPVQATEKSSTASSIYDYNNRYAVAIVINAETKDIAYAGFEADGTGSWNYADEFCDRSQSMTGHASFKLTPNAPNITRQGLTPGITYIINCWTKNGDVKVNNQTGKALYTIDEWTLYEFEISGINTVSISGTGTIDDLKLYPKGSLMSNFTYDPGIGKTSETGANNHIMYFDYDGLGRLIQLRDEHKNILKTIEYNYKQ
jgi:hypothetical protein